LIRSILYYPSFFCLIKYPLFGFRPKKAAIRYAFLFTTTNLTWRPDFFIPSFSDAMSLADLDTFEIRRGLTGRSPSWIFFSRLRLIFLCLYAPLCSRLLFKFCSPFRLVDALRRFRPARSLVLRDLLFFATPYFLPLLVLFLVRFFLHCYVPSANSSPPVSQRTWLDPYCFL